MLIVEFAGRGLNVYTKLVSGKLDFFTIVACLAAFLWFSYQIYATKCKKQHSLCKK